MVSVARYILLKKCIPGMSYENFRPNGYEIVGASQKHPQVVDTDDDMDLPPNFLADALMVPRRAAVKAAAGKPRRE